MAQTDNQLRNAGAKLAEKMFSREVIANMNLADIKAAVASIDATMDALPGTLTANRTIKQNFVDQLPEPFKSTSTAQQKALALWAWAAQEVGLI